ncbi:MAG: prolipoprotein diacylglyceryl transferase [Phycisphaerae bacterium]|nr:prolipoprotein diacylglyceryl transferase [Phycisphaerae bacterium]
MLNMLATYVWALNPVLIDFGPVQVRFYGVIFVLTMLCGFGLWWWQMRRADYPRLVIESFITWGVVATIVGARLGHCFFYNPAHYLEHPVQILYFWEGGLASHGATVGLITALLLYAWRWKLRPLELMDRFTVSAAVGAAGIRLGNFTNSEIVGRVTDVPWAVEFPLHDLVGRPGIRDLDDAITYWQQAGEAQRQALLEFVPARHPSQLYEFAIGVAVLGLLVLIDRLAGREKRPRGLLLGCFLGLYFTGRFCVEFVKQRHTLPEDSLLTMGQWLSIIPLLAGLAIVTWSLVARRPTGKPEGWQPPAKAEGKPDTQPEPDRDRRRRKRKS